MTDAALFRPIGPTTFDPTAAARGPWDPRYVHGAAIAALLAGRLVPPEGTLARLTIELLAPAPLSALHLGCGELAGGARVRRQDAVLTGAGRTVATARSVVVRRADLALPDAAADHHSPFDPAVAPPLDKPNREARGVVGHESFDSLAVVVDRMHVAGDPRVHLWIGLTLPVVEGSEIRGIEVAAVAADYAQSAVYRQLPFAEWSYRNMEQTLHLARQPEGSWIGIRSESVVQPVGAGFNTADLYDAGGRFGRSAAAIVVEQRPSPLTRDPETNP